MRLEWREGEHTLRDSGVAESPRTWERTFPFWERFSDLAPVAGRAPVTACSPEDRTEIILEAGTAFKNARQLTFNDLYPLVPASFEVDLGRRAGVQPFESIADTSVMRLDRTPGSIIGVHHALAQVSVAVAAFGPASWPEDELVRSIASALFGLSPEDFYLVVDVHLRSRDRRFSEPYYFDNYGDELDLVLPHALDQAGRAVQSPAVKHWLAELTAFPDFWRTTHPQLVQSFGVLDFTVAQVLRALLPDHRIHWDSFVE